MLFACYLLAPVTAVIGGAGVILNFYFIPALAVCAAYYALLLDTLFKCSRGGGWAGRFYLLAMAVVCVNLIPFAMLASEASSQFIDPLEALFLTIYGVYVCCSLAGAALACRNRLWVQAIMQLLWPVVFWLPRLYPELYLVSVFAFGLQGFQAMLLISLSPIEAAFQYPSPLPAIGWDPPRR